jgi:hypothetical protein
MNNDTLWRMASVLHDQCVVKFRGRAVVFSHEVIPWREPNSLCVLRLSLATIEIVDIVQCANARTLYSTMRHTLRRRINFELTKEVLNVRRG